MNVFYQVYLVFLANLVHWLALSASMVMLLMAGKIDWYLSAMIVTKSFIRCLNSMTD